MLSLTYPQLNLELKLKEGVPLAFVAEHPHVFTEFVQMLWSQTNGSAGDLFLLENGKEQFFNRIGCIIENPVSLNYNDRKILNSVYSLLSDHCLKDMPDETERLRYEISQFLDRLLQMEPFFLEAKDELDVQGLLKLYGVHLTYDAVSLLDGLISYMKLQHQICKARLFICVGLKSYLTESELDQLYDFLEYEQIFLLLVEGHAGKRIKKEDLVVIDSDLCVIMAEE